jgi:hypothetical protein
VDLGFIALLRVKMGAVLYRSNCSSMRAQYASLRPAAIERGCSIGANRAQIGGGVFETTQVANGAIQNNPSTFQQALYATSS